MKAKPVTYKGISFRSTLEAKHYINMTENFGWEVEYEPQIEGLYGWLPDFLIKGCERDILVEVKPIRSCKEWLNHPDWDKVENSGVFDFYENKPIYDLLILGATGFLKPDKSFSVFNEKTVIGFYFDMGVEKEKEDEIKRNPEAQTNNIFEPAELTYCFTSKRFGFSVCQGRWRDRINEENWDKPYKFFDPDAGDWFMDRDDLDKHPLLYNEREYIDQPFEYGLDREGFINHLNYKWNQIHSKYQWKPTK